MSPTKSLRDLTGQAGGGKEKKTVFVALSGGVDSSVAALLLKRAGYNVTGVFMKYWMDSDSGENPCCSLEARQDAMRVCAVLKMPFLTWDFQDEFKKEVVDDFVHGYKKGITPNPCVVCNKKIKLGMFLKKALKQGADYIATGHYIKLQTKNLKLKTIYALFQAKDKNKDQSYFLWTLTQDQLKHCLFPIGNYTKDEVREIAKKAKLPVALKKDSQEVCFVKDANIHEFLKSRINTNEGSIIELKTGKQIGKHAGVEFYTIGQRVPVGGTGPYYVVNKDSKNNQLIVARKDDKSLYSKEVIIKNVNWLSGEAPKSAKVLVRTRYRQPLVTADLRRQNADKRKLKIIFEKPQWAVTSGQSAVFYNRKGSAFAKASAGRELLGGGIIV